MDEKQQLSAACADPKSYSSTSVTQAPNFKNVYTMLYFYSFVFPSFDWDGERQYPELYRDIS